MTIRNQLTRGVLAMWIVATYSHAQTYSFRNVAGNSSIAAGWADGANAGAQFQYPAGVAVDSQGIVYVADQFNFVIRQITPLGSNWVVATIAGSPGQINSSRIQDGTNSHALFNAPAGIAV
ncbi:MAG: hypothetical protein ABSG04_06020, partial [Verrucomicrobiota bacterium]